MDSIIEVIRSRKAFWQGAPASEDQIAEAELRLGLKFADDYRAYVHAFGCASYYGHELTGVCPYKSLSVVEVTAELRDIYSDVPHDCYAVEEIHVDGLVIWQDATGAVYQALPGGLPERIASSLAEYVEGDKDARGE